MAWRFFNSGGERADGRAGARAGDDRRCRPLLSDPVRFSDSGSSDRVVPLDSSYASSPPLLLMFDHFCLAGKSEQTRDSEYLRLNLGKDSMGNLPMTVELGAVPQISRLVH